MLRPDSAAEVGCNDAGPPWLSMVDGPQILVTYIAFVGVCDLSDWNLVGTVVVKNSELGTAIEVVSHLWDEETHCAVGLHVQTLESVVEAKTDDDVAMAEAGAAQEDGAIPEEAPSAAPVDSSKLLYCERFTEFLIDLLSQLPTRR
jgi:hypothetical protein